MPARSSCRWAPSLQHLAYAHGGVTPIRRATTWLSSFEQGTAHLRCWVPVDQLVGSLRHTPGIIALVALARERGLDTVSVPAIDAREATLLGGVRVMPVPTLGALVAHLRGEAPIAPAPEGEDLAGDDDERPGGDLADVKGQEHARRALEVAAAGGHNLIMSGPPGAGKTLLARALPSILPAMSRDECLEVTKIHSVAGHLPPKRPVVRQRPFRAPHHQPRRAGRRRALAAAGRDQPGSPRRAVPRRATRVRPDRPRRAAPAAREWCHSRMISSAALTLPVWQL
jgi:hypothetical protein